MPRITTTPTKPSKDNPEQRNPLNSPGSPLSDLRPRNPGRGRWLIYTWQCGATTLTATSKVSFTAPHPRHFCGVFSSFFFFFGERQAESALFTLRLSPQKFDTEDGGSESGSTRGVSSAPRPPRRGFLRAARPRGDPPRGAPRPGPRGHRPHSAGAAGRGRSTRADSPGPSEAAPRP